jgi:L-iditol 2-dehydrogenase
VKLARYVGNGTIAIVDEPEPVLPEGGLLVRTEACGLCSGELMSWYMDAKVPHVIGHEVAGRVVASDDPQFPVGTRVFPHHHAPCLECDLCEQGNTVHCPQWRRTKLVPGGMAETFAVPGDNLNDCLVVDDLEPELAALIEPLACVRKSVRGLEGLPSAVIGLGSMGLLHALLERANTIAVDVNPDRLVHARSLGIDARALGDAPRKFARAVYVLPGSQAAFDLAVELAAPGAEIVLFAPLAPGESLRVPNRVYFDDLRLRNSYSCGPEETRWAADRLRVGDLRAEHVVSDFVSLGGLPEAYGKMKRGEILKAMVRFD